MQPKEFVIHKEMRQVSLSDSFSDESLKIIDPHSDLLYALYVIM